MRTQACLTVAILLLSAAAARAEDANEAAAAVNAFNSLYGEEYKRVTATPSPDDDVALARQLLEGAKAVANQPVFLAVLCDKAYELGSKDVSGYGIALEAMDLLAAKSPEKQVDCLQKRAAIYQRQYAAAPARSDARAKAGETLIEALTKVASALTAKGDADGAIAALRQALSVAAAVNSVSRAALQAEFSAAGTRQMFARQLAALKEKLAANPGDVESRKELVRLYLVEFDNPAEAAKYLDAGLDEPTRKFIPAAAKPVEEAPELACLELAKWFQGLAGRTATPFGKAAVLWRARGYYERYLDLHTANDMSQAAARLALARIQEALDALGPAGKRPAAALPWTDCLKQIDLTKAIGKWERKDGGLAATREQDKSCSAYLPFAAAGSYQFRFTAARSTGSEIFIFSLPAAGGMYTLMLTASETRMYTFVPREGGPQGSNRTLELAVKPVLAVPAGQDTTFDIKVLVSADKTTITVDQDNKPYLQWSGPTSTFIPMGSGFEPRPKMYVVAGSGIFFRRMEFRLLAPDGKAPAAPAPAAASLPTKPLQPGQIEGLKLVELAKHGFGAWELQEGILRLVQKGWPSRACIPHPLEGSYELEVCFVPKKEEAGQYQSVAVILPVGQTSCVLQFCAKEGSQFGGLEFVRGKNVYDTEASARSAALVYDQENTATIKVARTGEDAEIAVTANGKPYLNWKGPAAVLTNPSWRLPDARLPGVGAFGCLVDFKRVRIQPL